MIGEGESEPGKKQGPVSLTKVKAFSRLNVC